MEKRNDVLDTLLKNLGVKPLGGMDAVVKAASCTDTECRQPARVLIVASNGNEARVYSPCGDQARGMLGAVQTKSMRDGSLVAEYRLILRD